MTCVIGRAQYGLWHRALGLFFREGPNPHWTKHADEATRFEFMTIATLRAVMLGLSDDEFDVIQIDARAVTDSLPRA